MRRLLQRAREGEDRGAALALVAASMVVLLGMAAFGSDLGWFYLNASRVQRAADAAALGGVIWLPAEPGTADATALDIALRNGYDDTLSDVDVDPALVVGQPNQLQVTVTDEVPTFFAKILGFDSMTISRSAIAEFIPPLKLGSPDDQFGNSCDPTQPGCTGQPNFWANIHGKWTATSMGDAYSSWCTSQTDDPACPKNTSPPARTGGYLYGIESPGSFTVQGNDLAFHNTSGGNPTSDLIRTGDRGCEDWGPSASPDCGPTIIANLYAPDPTPLDVSDNALLCTAVLPPQPQVPATDPYSWTEPDSDLCWTQSGSGIYVLQIMIQDPGATTDRAGLNRYAVRVTGAGSKLFGLGDFALYNNASGTTTSFYLAEVPSYYHGKTFVVELWDPGDAPGGGTLKIVDPTGTPFDDGECRVYTRPTVTANWTLLNTIPPGNDCQEAVAPQEYNADWLKFEIDLPPDYACTDCWWKVDYDYPGGVQDTTTWRAYMIGNPIHLVD
ncbi:MAG TPA: TadG family pilus assembly protein [Acidimicrobiia bacterium]|nr:TadG family pilus assembly protein [Acidimicrobiia bacterium]